MTNLKIERSRTFTTRNINGKVLDEKSYYQIYKPFFFSRKYLEIIPKGWEIAAKVTVRFKNRIFATDFSTRQECEMLIQDIQNNPDKYILG